MQVKTRLFILLFFHCTCILIHSFSYAQIPENNRPFEHITIEQGLSQSAVTCIIQDSKGFMWFGTQDGLNMYDGYKFIVYKHSQKDTNSLSDNHIKCIIEDKIGNLWIGTWGGGLNKFDRNTGKFYCYKQKSGSSKNINNNFINILLEDKEGNIWIGTNGGGLNILTVMDNTFKYYTYQPANDKTISSNSINCLFEDSQGTIWIGTNGGGLNKFDKLTKQFKRYKNDIKNNSSLSNDWVTAIYEDKENNLLIGTSRYLNKFNRKQESFSIYKIVDSQIYISKINEDKNGTLWISTISDGLISFDKTKHQTSIYQHDPIIPESISLNNITAMIIDKSGVMWLGTYGGAINKLNLNALKFKLYKNNPNDKNSISSKSIRGIYEDKNNYLWISGYGGFDKIDRKNSIIKHYNIPDVFLFLEDANDDNIIWIGHEGHSISKYNIKTDQFANCENPHEFNLLESCKMIMYSACDDAHGTIWWGTESGLLKYDKQSKSFTSFKHQANNPNSISYDDIKAVYSDRSGSLWIGTNGGGLDKLEPKTNKFIHYTYNPNDTNSISSDRIRSIYQDKKGNLWIGTDGSGLNKLDIKKGVFHAFTTKDGLPNDVIYSILEDGHENLWLSTNKGICKFDPKTKKTKNFEYRDGLQSNEFNQGAYFKSKSGELFFGGINGVNSFYPDSIKDNSYTPPIVLTAFKKLNVEILLPKHISLIDKLDLNYEDKLISFEFASLDFTHPEKNQYAYMMEGFNKDWIYCGNKHEATYTNLDPGEYTFKVKGTNKDGVWNETPTTIRINIAPPWWQTWWFRIASFIALTICIYILFRYRVRLIEKQNIILEAQVKERTYELNEINKELEKLSIVAKETANGVFITDAEGNVEWFNEGFSKLFGWKSVEEFVKKRGRNIKEVSGHKNIVSIIDECIKDKKSITYESINLTKDGRELWIQATLTPVFDENGMLKKLVFVDADITELKKAKDTAEQALHIQEQFLANTSHEIRTPMNGVIGMSRQLLETPLTNEQAEYLNAIKESSNNLLHVVNDILDISKIRAGKIVFDKTEFRLNDLFKTLLFTLQYRAEEKNIYLKTIIDDELPPVLLGDPIRLNQILLNLAGNAIKFTETGGVTFSVKKIGEINDKVTLEFCITDTGIGIEGDKFDYIFESFAQAETHTTRKYGGTGLGLSISKSLVEQQGGHIYVSSQLGKGSSFCFTLQFEQGDPNWKGAIIRPIEGVPVNIDLGDIQILLVDDNKINQRIALFELNKWKAKTDIVDDAKSAFKKLITKKYDVILMDISMPGMDGLDATRYIRTQLPSSINNIPIIAMTASALSGEKEKCFASGMNDYISKPFNSVTLYTKIIKWAKGENVILPESVKISSKKEKKKINDLSLLREHASGDLEYIKEMITMYNNDMPVYLDEFNTFFNQQNWEELCRQAHKMKTPATLFGAHELKDTLNQIEISASELVDQQKIKDLVQKVNKFCILSIEELKIEMNKIV